MMVRFLKAEVEKSSSMPACQHHNNGNDHNCLCTNDKYKAPRRHQILKCIHLCVCVTCTYIHTYLPTTYPTTSSPHSDWVRWVSWPLQERPRSSLASVLVPLSWVRRGNLSSLFQVFCTQILRSLWPSGSRRYGRKHAKEIFINNCVQQQPASSSPAAEVQALASDPWSLLAPPHM
jgi:hypothetical protein